MQFTLYPDAFNTFDSSINTITGANNATVVVPSAKFLSVRKPYRKANLYAFWFAKPVECNLGLCGGLLVSAHSQQIGEGNAMPRQIVAVLLLNLELDREEPAPTFKEEGLILLGDEGVLIRITEKSVWFFVQPLYADHHPAVTLELADTAQPA